jgi:hypothetical protein
LFAKAFVTAISFYNDPTVRYFKRYDILLIRISSTLQYNSSDNGYDLQKEILATNNSARFLIDHQHHLSFFNKEINFLRRSALILMHNIPIKKKMKIIVADNLN